MKFRLGMLAAALVLTASTVFAQTSVVPTRVTSTPNLQVDVPVFVGGVPAGTFGWTTPYQGNAGSWLNTNANFGRISMLAYRAPTGVEESVTQWLRGDLGNCNGWNLWANPFGFWSNQNNQTQGWADANVAGQGWQGTTGLAPGAGAVNRVAGYNGYEADVYGIAAGLDKNFGSNLKIGLFASYADGDVDMLDWRNSNFRGEISRKYADLYMFNVGLYGAYKFNNWFAIAKTSYLYSKNDIGAQDDQDVNGWAGSLKIGYEFKFLCDFIVTPSVGIDYIYLKNDAYNVWTNNISSLRSNSYRDTSLELPVMINIAKSFATSFGSVTPFLRAGWIHEFHNDSTQYDARERFNNVPVGTAVNDILWKFRGSERPADRGSVGLGANANVNGRADLFASWDYEWGKRYYDNTFNIGFGLNF